MYLKYWNVFGPKLSASPGDPDYRGSDLPRDHFTQSSLLLLLDGFAC